MKRNAKNNPNLPKRNLLFLVLVFVVAIATLAYSGETRQAVMDAFGKVVHDVSEYLSGGASDGGGSA